jgi:hypothetical protein
MTPLPWHPFEFIPRGDSMELPFDLGWRMWDRAVIDLDAMKARGLNSDAVSFELLRAHQERELAEFTIKTREDA